MTVIPESALVAATAKRRSASGVSAALAGVAGFALLTAVLARVAVPVPGTPVPVTLQTVAVLLAGVVLGTRLGAASQSLYVVAGAVGLPVFAGARVGLTALTAGYLLGFVASAAVVGYLYPRVGRSLLGLLATCALGAAVILGFGVAWLAVILGGDVGLALEQGLWPFVLAESLKVAVTVALVRLARTSGRMLEARTWGH